MKKIGFKDKNGNDLIEGQYVKTYDRKGKLWVGTIAKVPLDKIHRSPITEAGGIQYAFESNYQTWINTQEYASELEIIK